MGCERGRDEEQPVHRVWVDGFEMAVYQVRNRDYSSFLEASRIPAPPGNCAGFGSTYTQEDIEHTGKTTVGGALRELDPTITVNR